MLRLGTTWNYIIKQLPHISSKINKQIYIYKKLRMMNVFTWIGEVPEDEETEQDNERKDMNQLERRRRRFVRR